jgi:hypothetical protein
MSELTLTGSELRKFQPEARRIIALAKVLGWSVRWTNQRHHVVALRTQGKEILVPSTNINAKRARSWGDQIINHSPLESLNNLIAGDLDMVKDTEAAEVVAVLGTSLMTSITRRAKERMNEEAATKRATQQPAPQPKKEEKVTAVMVESDVLPAPRLISTRPWMVRKGGTEGGKGTMYESPVVVVETYSDGSEVFRCRNCRYSNENPRSVSSHNSRAHPAKEERPEPVLMPVEHYEGSGLHREMSGARRLAADITSALDSIGNWDDYDKVELAALLAERIIEARPEREPAEPLTEAQIIARITALVDHGRLAAMHKEMETMTTALAAEAEARKTAEAEAEKWHGNLKALREMLDETATG